MKIGVGYSDSPNSIAAGKQAAQRALSKVNKTEMCDMVLLFCTARHNQQLLRDAVVSIVGNSESVFGGGAAGVITNEYFGYAGDQVGVVCFWLEGSECAVLAEKGLAKSEVETGMRLGKRLLERKRNPNLPMLLFYDAIDRSNGDMRLLLATWLLDGLKEGMGFLPKVMGAGLQGDHACTPTLQYTGAGMEEHSVISMTFSEDICIDHIIMHGCRPASPYYTVTKAEGSVILEINGRPALEYMDEILDSTIAPEDYPFFLLFGLNHGERWGEYKESNYASRLCLGVDRERGGIMMFEPDMVAGTEFQIMFRSLELDYMKPKIEEMFCQLGDREPLFALYIDCAGRCAGYGGIDVEDAIVVQRAVGDKVPLFGIYTGAEIAPIGGRSRGLDLTGVFCLFSKNKKGMPEKQRMKESVVWGQSNVCDDGKEKASLEAMAYLCEKNAAKVLALDYKSIAMRHELEQKRRGFSLLAELSVSLREGAGGEEIFFPVTQRINSALNMQKTVVLFSDESGRFSPRVLQGYHVEEQEMLLGQIIDIEQELLCCEEPILVTSADKRGRFKKLRTILGLPYFVAAPIVVKQEVAAILITGRMVEAEPFLARLGRSDVETVQAVSALLASVLVYRKWDDANKQAQSDGLTGLLNRGALERKVSQCLEKELAHNKMFALMILDCDYFKHINDSYGHMEGDVVLCELARFLETNFRSADYVARIGGDEFAVFCGSTDNEEDILGRVNQLVKRWSETALTLKEGERFYSTISIGIAFAPRDGRTYDELFKNADVALYKSKRFGRNQYTVYDIGDGVEKDC